MTIEQERPVRRRVTAASLAALSDDELVALFEDIAIQQAGAVTFGRIAKYNRLVGQMQLVKAELKSRPGDRRSLLTGLYEHARIFVRLKAAIATLAVEPDAAREVLQDIAKSEDYPATADARMALWRLADGRFVPE